MPGPVETTAGSGRIVIPGGSGFLGRTLSPFLADRGYEVIVLSRGERPQPGARVVGWDGRRPGAWTAELEGARAVINLAGRSVDCRYHAANRRRILDSRLASTAAIGRAIAACRQPPPAWLNASTATIYRHTYGEPHDEQGETGPHPEALDAFSIEVARAWERALEEAEVPEGTRRIALRVAMVFGREPGGVYTVLRRLTRRGLGGPMAGGRQYVSWMHAEDFSRAVLRLVEDPGATGVYNLCAPEPLTNAAMSRALRRVLGRPFGLPATREMIRLGAFFLRTEPELVVKSRRVIPARLLREGFVFRHPRFEEAIRDLEKPPGEHVSGAARGA